LRLGWLSLLIALIAFRLPRAAILKSEILSIIRKICIAKESITREERLEALELLSTLSIYEDGKERLISEAPWVLSILSEDDVENEA